MLTLNPFDRRCYEWDLAADIDAPDIALQLATILIPEEQSQSRYFMDAARDLLAGVINVFIECGDLRAAGPAWRLADLILAFRSPLRLHHILKQTELGRDLIALHLQGSDAPHSVLSTARTRLAPFEVIAAQWQRAGDGYYETDEAGSSSRFRPPQKISLRDFLDDKKDRRILVLGNNQEAIAPIQAINRVIFQRLTEMVLNLAENPKEGPGRRLWFFLDEARKLGRLEGLDDLLTNGRSKGACVVLGFQDIDGLKAVYGEEIAGELTTMCATIGFLKLSGVSTPQWASETFGEREEKVKMGSSSFTNSEGHYSTTDGENEQWRRAPLYFAGGVYYASSP